MKKLENLFASRGRVNFSIRGENAYGFSRVGEGHIRDEFDANWEDWIENLPAPVWEAVKRVRSQAIRMMWRVGYDRALLAVSLLANGEHLF